MFGIINLKNNAQIDDWIFGDKHTLMSTSLDESTQKAVDFPLHPNMEGILNIDEVFTMLQLALNLVNLGRGMQKQSKSSTMVYQLPFMSSVSCQFETVTHEAKEHYQRLSENIEAWGFRLHPVAGDGNYCFSALVCSLVFQILTTFPNFFSDHGLSLDRNVSVSDLASKLRLKAVDEWCHNADMIYSNWSNSSG